MGRDIFSPAAAYLAKGVPIEALGAVVPKIEWLPTPRFEITETAIHGEIVYIDHFGNLVSSIGRLTWSDDDMLHLIPLFGNSENARSLLPERCIVEIGGQSVGNIYITYANVPQGKVLALINSAGNLEVAVNHGSAAQKLNLPVGTPITLHLEP